MSRSKHTPGPWSVERDPNAGILKFGVYAGDYPVVSHFTAIEKEADARLIAAAPALLDALWKIAGETYDDSSEKIARAAIAKAEGVQ